MKLSIIYQYVTNEIFGIVRAKNNDMYKRTAIGRIRHTLEHTIRLMKKLYRKQKKNQKDEEENFIGYEVFPPNHHPNQSQRK